MERVSKDARDEGGGKGWKRGMQVRKARVGRKKKR
jgi:hypothetical protein